MATSVAEQQLTEMREKLEAPFHQQQDEEVVMSKKFTPEELAQIVNGLLIKPSLLGELDTMDQHMAFMRDIGEVVANHCGGNVVGVSDPEVDKERYMLSEYEAPLLSVEPNDSLPSLNENVWAHYDTDAEWDNQETNDENSIQSVSDRIATVNACRDKRTQLQGLLANTMLDNGEDQRLEHTMVDWRLKEGDELSDPSDDKEYRVVTYIGNQNSVEVLDNEDEPVFGFVFEVNEGVPALHIDTQGGDAVLHLHAVDGGLMLAPDNEHLRFESCYPSRFNYNDPRALFIK